MTVRLKTVRPEIWAALATLVMLLAFACVAFAQEAEPAPTVDPATFLRELLQLPALIFAINVFIKNKVRQIPNEWIPYIGPVLAFVVDLGAQVLAGINLTPAPPGVLSAVTAGALGFAPTGAHQTKQALKTSKQIAELEAEIERLKRTKAKA